MWNALAKLAELGSLLVKRIWPGSTEETTKAHPRDIATAQSSGHAADRSGKMTSQKAQREPNAIRSPTFVADNEPVDRHLNRRERRTMAAKMRRKTSQRENRSHGD